MDSEYDRYIVVSFVDVTLVLSIGDTVEEAFGETAPRCGVCLNRGTGDKRRGKRTGNPMDFPGNDGKMIENDRK